MKKSPPTRRLEPPTLEQFRAFVKKVVAVPKSEVDEEERAYRQQRKGQNAVRVKSSSLR
jgi:hypothetical protein